MHTDNRNLTSLQAGVLTLDQLPTSARTFDVCMAAVQLDGLNIEHVSWDTLSATPEQIKRLCMCAIQQDKYAIDHIPDKFKDADIYLKKVDLDINLWILSNYTSIALQYIIILFIHDMGNNLQLFHR